MRELIGQILGWLIVGFVSAMIVWLIYGFIVWDLNVLNWGVPFRGLYVGSVLMWILAWFSIQHDANKGDEG